MGEDMPARRDETDEIPAADGPGPAPVRKEKAVMTMHLTKNAVFSLEVPARGVTITCHSGTLWITRAGDARDYVVSAGASFAARGGGSLVVQALKEAEIAVRLPDRHPGRLRLLLSRSRLARAADRRTRGKDCCPSPRLGGGAARTCPHRP
jgi:hypothetical protein